MILNKLFKSKDQGKIFMPTSSKKRPGIKKPSPRVNNPWTLKEINKVITKYKSPYKPLFTEYKGQNEKTNWQCLKCNHVFLAHWKRMWKTVRGETAGGCPQCNGRVTYTISDVLAEIKSWKRPLECLSTHYENNKAPLVWRCLKPGCNRQWTNSFKSIKGGGSQHPQGCPTCNANEVYDIEIIKKIIKEKDFPITLLSDKYINNNTPLKWSCDECNNIWHADWANINCGEKGCPACSNPGKTEVAITKFLNNVFGSETFRSIFPEWLRYPENNRKLQIDSYSERLQIAIEVQGIQHYQFHNRYHRNIEEFKRRLAYDAFKEKRCKERGLHFLALDIRKGKRSSFKAILKEFLVNSGIVIPENFDKIPL